MYYNHFTLYNRHNDYNNVKCYIIITVNTHFFINIDVLVKITIFTGLVRFSFNIFSIYSIIIIIIISIVLNTDIGPQ